VLLLLVAASLTLLSLYYRETNAGPLHGAEKVVSTIFSPIQDGANRALKPVRDLVNWFHETFDARGEKDKLQDQVASLRDQLARQQTQQREVKELSALNELTSGGIVPDGSDPVTARVVGRSPTVWYSTVTIDHGSSSGIQPNDAVITGDGLVGRVDQVTGGTAQVQLITDHESAVSAKVLPDGPAGIVEPEVGDPDDLLLDFINSQDAVEEGQILITAGWSNAKVSSAYPFGIPLGTVSDTSSGDADINQRVHVRPFVDLRNLEYVQVLAGGPQRPGVSG
jgi:rod shape-determining protein MreC